MIAQGAVREAVPADLDHIVMVEEACFPGPKAYSRRQLKYLLERANSTCLVETDGKTLRGFVIILYRKRAKIAGIETLNVDPAFRGKGIASRLLRAAEEDMKRWGRQRSRLEVAEGNLPAKRLYHKIGYRVIKRLDNYYQFAPYGSRTALRMVKNLS